MEINKRIKEVALVIAPNYPDIKTVGPWEQLHAIESTFLGQELAIKDLHLLVSILQNKLGLSCKEVYDLFQLEKEIKNAS